MSDPQFLILIGTLLFIGGATYDDPLTPASEMAFALSLTLLLAGTIWWLV